MDKNIKLIPQTIKPQGLAFTSQDNVVTGLHATFEVNYGTQGATLNPDIWNELKATEKATAQKIYDKLRNIASEIITASQ